MTQLWPYFESYWDFKSTRGSPDMIHLIIYSSQVLLWILEVNTVLEAEKHFLSKYKYFGGFLHFLKGEIYQINKLQSFSNAKNVSFGTLRLPKNWFHVRSEWQKNLEICTFGEQKLRELSVSSIPFLIICVKRKISE